MPQASSAPAYAAAELADREALWRGMLWSGAPSTLVSALARSRFNRPADLTHARIAALAAAGALPDLADALALAERASQDAFLLRTLRAMREAREAAGARTPPANFVAEPGLVVMRLHPKLRVADHVGLTPEDARLMLEGLRRAMAEANELAQAPRP